MATSVHPVPQPAAKQNPGPEVTAFTPAQWHPAVATLVAAFAEDPVAVHLFPDPAKRPAGMAHIFRLALRYGKKMQMISGIHYNFSLPESVWPIPGLGDANHAYFALIRNFRRHAWMLLHLFGASPAVCASFVAGRTHELGHLAPGTPHAGEFRAFQAQEGAPLRYHASFEAEHVLSFTEDQDIPEMHDRIIAGLARRLAAPLIASDPKIVEAGLITVVW